MVLNKNKIIMKGDIKMNNSLKGIIKYEVNLLKDIDDSVGIKINDTKGLFIQVIDYGEGKEYLIELNNIDSDGSYESCADYNAFSEYDNINSLIATIENYLEDNSIVL